MDYPPISAFRTLFVRRDFDRPSRSAGSEENNYLATRISGEFQKLEMDPWIDTHWVKLQKPDRLMHCVFSAVNE